MSKAGVQTLLTLNAGSSSLKFRIFELHNDLKVIAGGKITGIGSHPVFRSISDRIDTPLPAGFSLSDAVPYVLNRVEGQPGLHIKAVAHRVVHGGPDLDATTKISGSLLRYLKALEPLAPLHQPHNLAAIALLQASHPDLLQFACFDTAFHAHHDRLSREFALPHELTSQGVRRYGFHGLSYAWIAHQLARDAPVLHSGRVIVAHLGNGASLCAMKAGVSVDTTMGLTALDGLPMGTRCGALDPGAVLYMQRALGLSIDDVEAILYEQSGLKGLSGLTNDVRALLESPHPDADFAIAYFCRKTAQHIAALTVSLGGLDGLVFTGGIGENAAPVRERILQHLCWLPAFETRVIAADEEQAMARDVTALLALQDRAAPDPDAAIGH